VSVFRLRLDQQDPVGEPHPLEDTSFSGLAAADGLLVYTDTSASISHWSPERGVTPIDSVSDEPWSPIAGGSDLTAFWSRMSDDQRLRIVDVRADRVVAEIPTAPGTPGDIVEGCFSPDHRHLAVRHVDQEAMNERDLDDDLFVAFEPRISLLDLSRPDEPPVELDVGAQVTGMTWTEPTVLLAATPDQLLAIDVTSGTSEPMAELAGADGWSVTSDGPGC
jgi:hypothetical protein